MGVGIVAIVADADGKAAFSEDEVNVRGGDFQSTDRPLRSAYEPVKRVSFMSIPAGWSKTDVFTDRRQFGVCMSGLIRFTVADGTSRDFGPGEAWRLVDVNVTDLSVEVAGSEPATCMITNID